MRNRRRNHTQTIQRKTRTQYAAPQKQRNYFPFFLIIILIAAAAGVYYYSDALLEYLPQSKPEAVETLQNKQPEPKTGEETTTAKNEEVYYTPIEKRIQLEILNGCGEKGVAKKLAGLLKKSKYDIVNSGNYIENGKVNWDVKESKIIDQINNQPHARELADLMGVLYSNVESYENPSPIADITIVIGKDYKTLSIFQ